MVFIEGIKSNQKPLIQKLAPKSTVDKILPKSPKLLKGSHPALQYKILPKSPKLLKGSSPAFRNGTFASFKDYTKMNPATAIKQIEQNEKLKAILGGSKLGKPLAKALGEILKTWTWKSFYIKCEGSPDQNIDSFKDWLKNPKTPISDLPDKVKDLLFQEIKLVLKRTELINPNTRLSSRLCYRRPLPLEIDIEDMAETFLHRDIFTKGERSLTRCVHVFSGDGMECLLPSKDFNQEAFNRYKTKIERLHEKLVNRVIKKFSIPVEDPMVKQFFSNIRQVSFDSSEVFSLGEGISTFLRAGEKGLIHGASVPNRPRLYLISDPSETPIKHPHSGTDFM